MKPGPKSSLTPEVALQIRSLYLQGMNYKTIRETLGLTEYAWDQWYYHNRQDFRTKIQQWKHERIIKKAEEELEVLIHSDDERIKTSNLQFALKTLGKDKGYSERTELTGKDGTPVNFVLNSDLADRDKIE